MALLASSGAAASPRANRGLPGITGSLRGPRQGDRPQREGPARVTPLAQRAAPSFTVGLGVHLRQAGLHQGSFSRCPRSICGHTTSPTPTGPPTDKETAADQQDVGPGLGHSRAPKPPQRTPVLHVLVLLKWSHEGSSPCDPVQSCLIQRHQRDDADTVLSGRLVLGPHGGFAMPPQLLTCPTLVTYLRFQK